MKIFAIRDETDKTGKDLAYLLYYEQGRLFYIELPDHADEWETPLILSSFVKKGEYTVNSYWSRVWVQQRIVPTDRQNLPQILRDNGLKEYDEFALLMLANGRCAQDDYYLCPIREEQLPEEIRGRWEARIEDAVALDGWELLVFFRNGCIRKCDLKDYLQERRELQILYRKPEWFQNVTVQTGGYGVQWDENMSISDEALSQMGILIPLKNDDFRSYVARRTINAAEAAQILNCTRQYINKLVKTGKLHPVKTTEKSTLFLKNEIMSRKRGI